MPFRAIVKKPVFVLCALAIALIAEFFLLEGTLGVSLPQDRDSAISRVEIRAKGTDLHFVTHNKRFTVVDALTKHGSHREALILRETFYMDRDYDMEGPPNATGTVEAINGRNINWAFHEPGEGGDAVTDDLYMVTNYGDGETGNTYTYFSLVDGRKLRINHYSPLSASELEALDRAVLN